MFLRDRCGCWVENRLRSGGGGPPSRLSSAHEGQRAGSSVAAMGGVGRGGFLAVLVGFWKSIDLVVGPVQGVGVTMNTERQVNTGKRQARAPTLARGIPSHETC